MNFKYLESIYKTDLRNALSVAKHLVSVIEGQLNSRQANLKEFEVRK